MEEWTSINTVLPNLRDKSKVLDVKPLRTLVPQFPTVSNGPPFVCAPPNGPLPSGFSPFSPFSISQGSHSMPGLNQNEFYPAVPIQLFRAEPSASNGQNAHEHKSVGLSSVKNKANKRKVFEFAFTAVTDLNLGISLSERDDGNRELVENVLWRFDALRRKLSQMEDSAEPHSGIIKRSVLKASNIMMSKGVRTNARKRIRVIPCVEIGDIFFFRLELCLVGLHAQCMAGIDPMSMKGDLEGRTSGLPSGDKEASDQKLVRDNLALEMSLHRVNEKWKGGLSSRDGLVLPDLTSGAESIPVSLVNEDGIDGESNEYGFQTNRVYESFKWNYKTKLEGEESSDTAEDYDMPSPLTITSKNSGNVARFMNDSCSPNVFWQPIMYKHNHEVLLHIAFFAKRHTPLMTELTYDYGIPHSDESESNGADYGKKKCLCGSPKCQGYFY
ncbi:Heat shock protein 70 (Hsp 70) family protein isoform 1 [Hibiscus syriacus]|uniref:Heat shock protein 70 (Hsp 70) family protein isoform 1 n=1 Tax=Hibiscus syriacus TaxID=106335 RepID=A0A6A2YAP4_HIBSY|nr:Heat shock protein 70 (Hsp 70) family protein isoform 1 [Hibiscus syriacus]